MRQHNQTDPLFKATEDFVKTDLFRLKEHRDPKSDRLPANKRSEMAQRDLIKTEIDPLNDLLNEVQVRLLSALQKEPKADYNTLAELLNVRQQPLNAISRS